MSSPDYLQISQRVEGSAVVVRAVGEVDVGSAPALSWHLSQVTAASTPPDSVILDLRQAELFGSSGLAVLVTAYGQCQRRGTSLRVVAGPSVTRRLQMVGLQELLSVGAVLSEALPDSGDTATDAATPAS